MVTINKFNFNLLKPVMGKVSRAERKCGIVMKKELLHLPEGFWVCWVEVDKIKVDEHQREPDHKHIRSMSGKNFKRRYVDMPYCTCRSDGKYEGLTVYVEDHHHTLLLVQQENALITLSDGTRVMECLVNFDMTKAESAVFFSDKNHNRKKVSAWKIFSSAYAAEKYEQTTVINLANKHKLTTPLKIAKRRENDLQHLTYYVNLVKNDGKTLLDKAFCVQSALWKGEKHSLTLFKGLIYVLKSYKDVDVNRIIKEMASYGVGEDFVLFMVEYADSIKCKLGNERNDRAMCLAWESVLRESGVLPRMLRKAA
jgi:hypothetical protein